MKFGAIGTHDCCKDDVKTTSGVKCLRRQVSYVVEPLPSAGGHPPIYSSHIHYNSYEFPKKASFSKNCVPCWKSPHGVGSGEAVC